MTGGPFAALTRHFVATLLRPPILTDLGADYLRRTIASLVAMVLIAGIFLTRAFFRKYTDLGGLTYPDAYMRALQSDTLFMIAMPMLIVGIAAVLLCPLLFPDEVDYQVLTPLPLTRATIFGAKLAAIAIAGGVIVIAVCAISSFWFPLATGGRRAPHPAVPRIAAHAVAAVLGSAWMFSAIAAIQGLTLIVIPTRWRRLALAWQGSTIVFLLIAVPFITRLPATEVTSHSVTLLPLAAFPPVWFFGIEQWLLDPDRTDGYAVVAAYAGRALLVTLTSIIVSYALTYRHAERLVGLSLPSGSRPRDWSPLRYLSRRFGMRPPAAGVIAFSITVLTRSRLHQFVFLIIAGSGVGVLIGQVATALSNDIGSPLQARTSVQAALAAPLLTALAVTLGLRAAFLQPADRAAAWIFRITEEPGRRAAVLDAVALCFTAPALILSMAIAVSVQPGVIGAAWLLAAPLTGIACVALIEVVLADWNRIPFTCSYLPGKRVLAYTLGVLLAAYFTFVYLGAHLLRWALTSTPRTLMLAGLSIMVVVIMRRSRLRTWGTAGLDFEDYDPMAVRTLGLLPDEH